MPEYSCQECQRFYNKNGDNLKMLTTFGIVMGLFPGHNPKVKMGEVVRDFMRNYHAANHFDD